MSEGVLPPESASENVLALVDADPARLRDEVRGGARGGVAIREHLAGADGHGVTVATIAADAFHPGVEPRGIEPLTFWLPAKRSPS